jgi:hypothetical protein
VGDYPDWTRLFYLTGTSINIPINIAASDVTLPVSIDAVTAELYVTVLQSLATIHVGIQYSVVTLDVNISDSQVTIDINFMDQSVAVFDAAKWFAHQAAQWGVTGGGSIASGAYTTLSRVVPAGKVAFVCGLGVGYLVAGADVNIIGVLNMAGTDMTTVGFNTGGGLAFDTPFRATAGQTVSLYIFNFSGATKVTVGSIWGYDEPA